MTVRPPAQRPARPAPPRPGPPAALLRTRPVRAVSSPRDGCLAACAAGAAALPVAALPAAGPALAALLVGTFVLLGPGLALLPHLGGVRPDGGFTGLPRSAAAVLVPVVGVSVVVLATTAAADAAQWHPRVLLAALAVLTAASTRLPVRAGRTTGRTTAGEAGDRAEVPA